MKKNHILETDRLRLTMLTKKNITNDYVSWLNDPEINQFLESRFQKHTIESLEKFFYETDQRDDIYFFAINHKDHNLHIGNIKIGPIDYSNNCTSVGYIIGNKNFHGQGFASESLKRVCEFCFHDLDLFFIDAGVVATNKASIKLLERCKFKKYSTAPKKCNLVYKRDDELRYYINRDDYVFISSSKSL